MPMDYMNWGPGMMVVMSFVSLLVIVGIVAGVVFLVRALGRHDAPRGAGPDAVQILEERFARGEIDKQEYESRRSLLSGRTR